MPTIAHLSDIHLDGSDERLARLTRVLDEAACVGADAVVLTGDLADRGLPAEYAQFRDAMAGDRPWIAVPGNHDLREAARPFLGDTADGPLDQVLDIPGLRIVGLDSLVEGATEGALAQASLEFADRAVRSAPGPVVLALHHPPVPVGHQVMDELGLRDPGGLARIAGTPAVAAVLTGHVHTSLAARFAGTPLLGAGGVASTMRLGSRTDPIADARAMPAFAVHVFDDDGWVRTVFHPLSPQA
ncbi:MAG TPA: metallophosphoesterase [Trebonia sp.]